MCKYVISESTEGIFWSSPNVSQLLIRCHPRKVSRMLFGGEQDTAVVMVVVRGKVSTWRGIKKALWDSAGHLSITERWGRRQAQVGEWTLIPSDGHDSALLTLTHSQGSQTHTGCNLVPSQEKTPLHVISYLSNHLRGNLLRWQFPGSACFGSVFATSADASPVSKLQNAP